MPDRLYDALILDIDGTLIGDSGQVDPYTAGRIQRLQEHGVPVFIATGRSESYLTDVTGPLRIQTPVICYNGAALFDPVTRELEVKHALSQTVVAASLAYCTQGEQLYAVCMAPGEKFAAPPRSSAEAELLEAFYNVNFVARPDLPREGLIRVSLFSEMHPSSSHFADEVGQIVPGPHYLTHFPLNLLPPFRHRQTQVLDLHAPCDGKAEALTLIEQQYQIPRARVVAIGDAENDRPIIEQAGLGVAMENGMESIRQSAQRVIGPCESPAIGKLIDELFLD